MNPVFAMKTTLTNDDILALQKLALCRARRLNGLFVVAYLALMFGVYAYYGIPLREMEWWVYAVALFLLLWTVVFLPQRAARIANKRRNPKAGSVNTFAFYDDDMTVEDAIETTRLSYSGLLAVIETDEYIFFLPDKAKAYILPKRDCPDAAALMDFIRPKLSEPVRRNWPK